MSLSKKVYWENIYALARQYIDEAGIDGYKKLLSSDHGLRSEDMKFGFNAKLNIHKTLKNEAFLSGLSVYYMTYSFYWCDLLVASTSKGICFLGFISGKYGIEDLLKKNFPKCKLMNHPQPIHLELIEGLLNEKEFSIDIHLIGTPFQLAVWDKLLELSTNQYITYKEIAESLVVGKAYQAVGSAVGMNPISLLIPCHQVLSSSEKLTGYRWGIDLKLTLLMGQLGIK